MDEDFNLQDVRKAWANRWLAHVLNDDHCRISETAKARYAVIQVEMFAEACIIGLATEVAPAIDRFLAWMNQPEPSREPYIAGDSNEEAWWVGLWQWRLSEGVARWLKGMPSHRSLAAAAAANIEGVERIEFQQDAEAARSNRRQSMGLHLASMLASDMPAAGLKLMASVGMGPHAARYNPAVAIGRWACEYLAPGRSRDETFVRGCEKMLGDGLMSRLLAHAAYLESVLLLKTLYFDSGIVRTAGEAISRAHDWLPNTEYGRARRPR